MTSPTPPHARYGGTLDFNGNGIAGCVVCGWRGVPTCDDGARSVRCPCCYAPQVDAGEPEPVKISRNAPCPCGSGVKAKKCGCAEFAV